MVDQVGTTGNDALGGSGSSEYRLIGLTGNDSYTFRLFDISIPQPNGPPQIVYSRDSVVERANEGIDTVYLKNLYTPVGATGVYPAGLVIAAELANIENIYGLAAERNSGGQLVVLPWTITAGAGNNLVVTYGGNDTLDGGAGNDIVNSGAGNDRLSGGLGADTLFGGAGNDVYGVDNAGDIVNESTVGAGGVDTVISTVNFSLLQGASTRGVLENLSLAGTANIYGVGNALNNVISGNAGANTIYGGAGHDSINGGAGNDILFGDAGNDTLNGSAGGDAMVGGAGNDVFFIDNAGDLVGEAVNGGFDTVNSTVSLSAASIGAYVENINLIGVASINAVGNGLANTIVGNIGNNSIQGGGGNDVILGGAGNDVINGGLGNDVIEGGRGNNTLTGGVGSDYFRFLTAPVAGESSLITDYSVASDSFILESAMFARAPLLAPGGVLDDSAFVANANGDLTGADRINARIVYNTTTGDVFSLNTFRIGEMSLLARLAPNLDLSAADFHVI